MGLTLVVPDGQGQAGEQDELWLDDGAEDQFLIRHVPAGVAGREVEVIDHSLVVPNGQGHVGWQAELWLDDGASVQSILCHVFAHDGPHVDGAAEGDIEEAQRTFSAKAASMHGCVVSLLDEADSTGSLPPSSRRQRAEGAEDECDPDALI